MSPSSIELGFELTTILMQMNDNCRQILDDMGIVDLNCRSPMYLIHLVHFRSAHHSTHCSLANSYSCLTCTDRARHCFRCYFFQTNWKMERERERKKTFEWISYLSTNWSNPLWTQIKSHGYFNRSAIIPNGCFDVRFMMMIQRCIVQFGCNVRDFIRFPFIIFNIGSICV